MTNNELSRKVLETLCGCSGVMTFRDLTSTLKADARAVFKNLFFLEEKGYVQLSTSYPGDAVYPQIHLVKLRDPGREIAADMEKLYHAFPISEDHRLSYAGAGENISFEVALNSLARRVREKMEGEERELALEKIESLLGLPFIVEPVAKNKGK